MTYAIKRNGQWEELPVGRPIEAPEGFLTAYGEMLKWSPQYRTAQGIKVIQESPVPEGKYITSQTIIDVDDKPTYQYTYADIVPVEPTKRMIDKVELTRRVTEEEAEMLNAQLELAEPKLRLLYQSISMIHLDAPEYPILESIFVGLFGRERADVLLAPTHVE